MCSGYQIKRMKSEMGEIQPRVPMYIPVLIMIMFATRFFDSIFDNN